jgi:protein PhnA
MIPSPALLARAQHQCELCNQSPVTEAHGVAPRHQAAIENQVALCAQCAEQLAQLQPSAHWRCLEGSIWNPEPAVQVLSYRLVHHFEAENWARQLLESVYLDEDLLQWALPSTEAAEQHRDAYGQPLENGDTIVLTQALNVKGTNFSAPKGTVVKKIRLVHDNPAQIEGKINEQVIVILTQYVKKG